LRYVSITAMMNIFWILRAIWVMLSCKTDFSLQFDQVLDMIITFFRCQSTPYILKASFMIPIQVP
jgi:hypothetical protein